ncbi:DUF493 domain-containing protein [Wenzhouxiangella sp. AB-CW3]|uniref:YbeD family protein n=1 Tax=Wenzhouxiangella sp. AB-CW3 TaxID=2771012 RepID=UPI00168AB070|nr:DUF493 domain-containing protein [Wenzhouxiangella sp. AB-CW3]QOC22797.1 DUF493 domain-containing protein [Wenzhouxiangella sp. AB-CW3]
MVEHDDGPLEFPCRWPVKAMVRSGEDVMAEVLRAIGRHAELPDEKDVRVRPSRHGRFESITVTIEVRSRSHLESVYSEVRDVPAVVMTL